MNPTCGLPTTCWETLNLLHQQSTLIMREKLAAMSFCSPMKSRENNEEIVVVVIVTETSGEVSGSIVFPKDTQILVIPLYLLTIFNGAKVHRV